MSAAVPFLLGIQMETELKRALSSLFVREVYLHVETALDFGS